MGAVAAGADSTGAAGGAGAGVGTDGRAGSGGKLGALSAKGGAGGRGGKLAIGAPGSVPLRFLAHFRNRLDMGLAGSPQYS